MKKPEKAKKIKTDIIAKLESSTAKGFRFQMIRITVLLYLAAVTAITLMDIIIFQSIHGDITLLGLLAYIATDALISFIVITIISSILINILTLPIVRIMKRHEKGEQISNEEFFTARKRTNRIPEIIFIINIAYPLLLGLASTILLGGDSMQGFPMLLRNVSIFVLAGLCQNALYQKALMKPRAMLKIYSVDKAHSNWFAKHLDRIQLYATALFICAVLVHSTIANFEELGGDIKVSISAERADADSSQQTKQDSFARMREKMNGASDDRIEKAVEEIREKGRDFGAKVAIEMLLLMILTGVIIASTDAILTNTKETQTSILRKVLTEMSEGSGDLTQRILIVQGDNIGLISEKINGVFDRLQLMFRHITDQAAQVAESSAAISAVLEGTVAATEEMAASVNQINYNADRNRKVVTTSQQSLEKMLSSLEEINNNVNTQAAYVEQTSSAMTEMIANIQSVNEVTSKANDVSESLNAVSSDGSQAVLNSITAVKDIEAASLEVNNLVITISKILAQTNMLAMNAAIEAAHAGDAGRGFAVVAEEVRNLADDSATNLKTISVNMRDVLDRVNRGVDLSETAGDALKQVGEKTSQTTQLMSEVASAMQEQAAGANEVLNSINSLVEASNSINRLSDEQHQNNEIMKDNLSRTVNAFAEVQSATSELAEGNNEILRGIDDLKEVINRNEEVVAALQNELGGFKI